MKAVRIQTDGSVKLPKQVLRRFPKRSELAVWAQGDTIILKRVNPAPLTRIAEQAPDGGPPLKEVTAEVHRMRTEKRR